MLVRQMVHQIPGNPHPRDTKRKAIGMKQKDLLTQLQIRGVDLNASGLSKLEGQIRSVCDTELIALSDWVACADAL